MSEQNDARLTPTVLCVCADLVVSRWDDTCLIRPRYIYRNGHRSREDLLYYDWSA